MTTTNPPDLSSVTADQVRADIIDICQRFPDRVNPETGRGCAYTSSADPTWHCVVGQWFAERGVTLPGPFEDANSDGVSRLLLALGLDLPESAIEVLQKAQAAADTGHRWRHVPREAGWAQS